MKEKKAVIFDVDGLLLNTEFIWLDCWMQTGKDHGIPEFGPLFYKAVGTAGKDIEDMQKEIEHRKVVVRPELLEHVKDARAQGDLSENFEYYAAKREKNKNESRIRYLERMIKTAVVIEDETEADEVGLNKTVEVEFADDGSTATYKIVTTVRGNSLAGLISTESPVGKALLGHKVGDTVHVQVNPQVGYDLIIKDIKDTKDEEEKLRSF